MKTVPVQIAELVACLTEVSEVPGAIPGLATYLSGNLLYCHFPPSPIQEGQLSVTGKV